MTAARLRHAALSGSQAKAPGFAGGYLHERRFCVLDVDSAHQSDHPDFAALMQQMENGGREAMLHELLEYDYSDINLREPPATEALLDQKLLSLEPHEPGFPICLP